MSNIKINDVPQRIQYAATTGQTQFTIPFPFFQNSFVVVWQDGIQIFPGASPGQYLISGAGSPSGGLVTLITPAIEDSIITIEGQMPIDRTSIYSATISNLTGSDLNGDFNREVVMLQQLHTTQAFLQLQYAPWALISQDLNVTKDRYIPLLPNLGAWRMNASGTAIETFQTPDGTGLAPDDAPYLLQTANSNLDNAIALDELPSGFMVNEIGTGLAALRTIQPVANQTSVTNGDGVSGNPVFGLADNAILPGTAGMGIPSGTTAERVIPTPPSIGLRYNTDTDVIEAYINSAWVEIPSIAASFLPLAGGTMQGNIDMDGNQITALPIPTTADEPATKGYVDGLVLNVIPACNYTTTANLSGYTYSNGSGGIGASLTAGSDGAFTTDGASPALNDRILVPFQTNAYENGVYVLTQVGDVSTPAILTRALDYDQSSQMQAGDRVDVVAGTTYAGSQWMMTQTAPITVGTTDITWLNIASDFVTLTTNQTISAQKTFSATPIFTDIQLGGSILDSNGNTIIGLTPTASAVNYVEFANADAGGSPSVDAVGSDSNITLFLRGKGTSGAQTQGRSNGLNASNGYIGEFISSYITVGSKISLTTSTPSNVTSIDLPAGDWDVSWSLSFETATGTSVTVIRGGASLNSATVVNSSPSQSQFILQWPAYVPNVTTFIQNGAQCRQSLAATTTIYLVAQSTFTVAAMYAYGWISARRI